MAKNLPYPSRTARSSEVFQTPGAPYDFTQEAVANNYNDMLRKRVNADYKSGRANDPMYDVADAREIETKANSSERGLGPTVAKRELLKRSDEGEFAAPGYGDLGQFAGGSGKEERLDAMEYEGDYKRGGKVKKMASGGMTSKASPASRRGDGIAQRGKTKGRMC
jgi:hypothetical protein